MLTFHEKKKACLADDERGESKEMGRRKRVDYKGIAVPISSIALYSEISDSCSIGSKI